jgi:hypothetical protein
MPKEENKTPPVGLTHEGLDGMKKNDFLIIFKKPAIWKKAKAVLFIAKHQFTNGKSPLVAIPYKNMATLKKSYTDSIKKKFTNKNILLANIKFEKVKGGNPIARISPNKGGLKLDDLQTQGEILFANLKTDFEVLSPQNKSKEPEEENKEATEFNSEETTIKEETGNKTPNKEERSAAKSAKIQENLGKLEKGLGKLSPQQVQEKLDLFNSAIAQMDAEASLNKKEIAALTDRILGLEVMLKDVKEAKNITANINKILDQLKAIG